MKKVAIIFSILICIFICGCIKNEKQDVVKETILINIDTNSSDYFILLPVLLRNDSISGVFNNLKIQNGTGTVDLSETDVGMMLNISGSKSLTIYGESESDINSNDYLEYTWSSDPASRNRSQTVNVFFSNSTNERISLTIEYEGDGTGFSRHSDYGGVGTLDGHWKILRGRDFSVGPF